MLSRWPCCLAARPEPTPASRSVYSHSPRIEQNPEHQALRLQRALAYLEDNQRELFADIQLAETMDDPIAAAYTHGVLLHRQQNYAAARLILIDTCRHILIIGGHWIIARGCCAISARTAWRLLIMRLCYASMKRIPVIMWRPPG